MKKIYTTFAMSATHAMELEAHIYLMQSAFLFKMKVCIVFH